jgi:hypothetical protein
LQINNMYGCARGGVFRGSWYLSSRSRNPEQDPSSRIHSHSSYRDEALSYHEYSVNPIKSEVTL